MKAGTMRRMLPLLLAAGLWAVTAAAVAETGAGHGQGPQQTHQAPAGEAGHGTEPAAAAHGGDAHGKTAAAHGGGHAAPMVTAEKLKDLLWRTLNFAALVFILVKFAGKPVTEFLSRRRRDIERDLTAMEAKRDKAKQDYEAFEARLAGMEQEIGLIVQRAVALAEEERGRILAEAEEAGREIRRQAAAAVQAAEAEVRARLREEAAEQAAAMAERLIVKNLTKADHTNIIEQYLDKAGRAQL